MAKRLYGIKDSLIYRFLSDSNYELLSDGKIFTYVTRQGHVSKNKREKPIFKNKAGYLCFSYKGKKVLHHRAMYAKFIGVLDAEMTINHKNGNISDNRIENLELVSIGENLKHKYHSLKQLPVSGNQKIPQAVVDEIRKLRDSGYSYKELMFKFKIAKSTLSYLLNRKTFFKDTTGYKVK